MSGNSLTAKQETLDGDFAQEVLSKYYGIKGDVKRLPSERDQNFLVFKGSQPICTIKFAHPSEDRQASSFQTEMVHYINVQSPDTPVQKVLPSLSGIYELYLDCQGHMRATRVFSYLEGKMLSEVPTSISQRYNLGIAAGSVTKALEGFSHPGQDHLLLWDIQHASLLRDYVSAVEDPQRRNMLLFCLANFEKRAKPQLPRLRKQIVHNDYSPQNVLVDAHAPDIITGILDFGDAVLTPVACDVAVGACYQMGVGGTLLDGALAFIQGYDSIVRLRDEEISVLFDLILTRMFVRLVISEWRAKEFPENKTYILRNVRVAWQHLEELLSMNDADGRDRFNTFRAWRRP